MPTRAETFEALLSTIYRAALDAALWPDLLMQAADHLGGTSAWLSDLDSVTGEGEGVIARIDPAMPVLYQARFAALNPFPAAALRQNPQAAAQAGAQAGHQPAAHALPVVQLASDLVSDPVLVRSEYYNGFMRPQDVHAVLIIRLDRSGSRSAAININRPRAWGPFSRRHLAMAAALAGHLARAFHLGRTMGHMRATPDAKPALLLDAECRPRHVNARAAHLLAAGHAPLSLARGTLALATPHHDAGLRQAAARAALGPPIARQGSVIVSGGLILSISPAPGAYPTAPSLDPDHDPGHPPSLANTLAPGLALVVIDDMATDPATAQHVFTRALRLTPTESRIAYAFLTGATPRDIALRHGVSPHTIRVHFAHIFTKAGVTRQADLARLLDRVLVAGTTAALS